MSKALSLNTVYEYDNLYFWCNAMGEILLPGGSLMVPHTPDELPPAYKNLYQKYQQETDYVHTYVVTFNGVAGMLLTALHDRRYYDEILAIHDDIAGLLDNATELYGPLHVALMSAALYRLYRCAEDILDDDVFCKCSVLVGSETDPAGHELCVFVPESECEKLDSIREHFIKNYCWRKKDEEKLRKAFQMMMKK